jgi:hypothetical protein
MCPFVDQTELFNKRPMRRCCRELDGKSRQGSPIFRRVIYVQVELNDLLDRGPKLKASLPRLRKPSGSCHALPLQAQVYCSIRDAYWARRGHTVSTLI